MLEDGRRHREQTGKSLMVPRYDIVPIPKHVEASLAERSIRMLAPGSIEMPTAQSVYWRPSRFVAWEHGRRPGTVRFANVNSVNLDGRRIDKILATHPARMRLRAESGSEVS